MIEEQKTVEIGMENLVSSAEEMMKTGYRLVQIGAVKKPDYIEVNYTFDKDLGFLNYRIKVPLDKPEVPSVSKVYWAAFTYENEIHDLFGVKFKGLNIDFRGHFYSLKVKTPFNCVETPKVETAKTGE